jgi:uncharacterized membrane protein
MIRAAALLLTLLTGCAAASEQPYAPTRSVDYGARGHDPFWMVTVGDDQIVLTQGAAGGAADGEFSEATYPRALPVEQGGVRRWESGAGIEVIAIEARPGPCSDGGRSYEDKVKVYLSGVMLEGCGGREIGGRG